MKDQYHHGNLKQALIENAIEIIAQHGVEQLSLRSLSKQCGVSHNAIYRHFESKEKMIDCCREYVTDSLTDYLSETIAGLDYSDPATIDALSYAYIDFFKEHPAYFDFIYDSKAFCKIVFSLDRVEGNYPPFEIFRTVCIALIQRYQLTEAEGLKRLVKYWAIMQGVVSFIISPNVELDGSWADCLNDIF